MTSSKILVSVLLLLPVFFISCSKSGQFRMVEVERGPFHIKVHAIGQLRSSASTIIACPSVRRTWRYTIRFMAAEGKEVKAGEMILAFDAKKIMERLQLKQSELQTAKKELERTQLVEQEKSDNLVLQLAEAKVNREKALQRANQPENLVALNDVKKARMDLELAELKGKLTVSRVRNQKIGKKTRISALKKKIKRLDTEVKGLTASLKKMKIKAPKAGMVVYALDWNRRKKAVGDTTYIGQKLLELPDLSKMEVAAVIPEPQAGKIKVGQLAEIRLDSNPDRVFNGKIKSLGRIFRTKSNNQPAMVFDAVIEILNPDPELMRPGMAAGVDLIISSKEDVLQVPEAAIIYHEKGLFVLKDGLMGKKRVKVKIGARSAGNVEILEGLKEHHQIAIRTSGGEGEK